MKTERQIEEIIKRAAQRAQENRARRTALSQSLREQEPADDRQPTQNKGEAG